MKQVIIKQFVVGMVATNCYFAIHEATKEMFVVDPGAEDKRLIHEIEKENLLPKGILLTHGHFDHAGAAKELQEHFSIPVFAYKGEEETLSSPYLNLSSSMGGEGEVYLADTLLPEGVFSLAGFDIHLLAIGGHTTGGCCYYLPSEDIVFTGDSLFCGSVGRTDFPGGNMRMLVDGIKEKLFCLPEDTVCLPGHDARTTIGQEKEYNPFLAG